MKTLLSLLLAVAAGFTTSVAQELTVQSASGATLGSQCAGNPSLSFTTRAGTSTIRVVRVRNILGSATMPTGVDFKIFLSGMSDVNNSDWTVIDSATMSSQIDDILSPGNATAQAALACTTSSNVLSGTLTLPGTAGAKKTYYIRYKPSVASPSSDNITLKFVRCNASADCDGSTTSGLNPTLDLPLGGSVIVEEGFVVGLVLDRSGSMSAVKSSGGPTRSTSLRNATKYFFGLLQTRAMTTTPVNIPDDILHVVTFDDIVENWALTTTPQPATSGTLSNLITQMGTHAQLNPRGTTAIGNAVHQANSVINMVGGMAKKKVLVFTDGEENVSSPRSILPAMTAPDVSGIHSIHTVGIGSEIGSSFQVNLKNYAAAHSGTYTYISELPSTPSFDIALEKAYLRIFNDLVSWEGAIDPTFQVLTDTVKTVTSAWVTGSDGQAIFSVFEDIRPKKNYTLAMQSPKGEILTNGAMGSGITSTVVNGDTYTIFKADFTTAADITDYSGEWKLILTPANKERTLVPLGFSVSVLSNLTLSIGTATGAGLPGEPLKVAIDLKEGDALIQKVRAIKIIVKDPNGNEFNVPAARDVNGTWYGTFAHTHNAGTYEVFSRVSFSNLAGEPATREKTSYVTYGTPLTGSPVVKPCFSCSALYITIAVAFLVLVILALVIRAAILKSKHP